MRSFLYVLFVCFLSAFSSAEDNPKTGGKHQRVDDEASTKQQAVIRNVKVYLNQKNPEKSYAVLFENETESLRFMVGFGAKGITPKGERFKAGHSLLGNFQVNAVLSQTRFEMESKLLQQSGKSSDFLRENLFKNMSSVDFDGDSKANEYGSAFLGLEPIDSRAKQPFHFGEYKGVYRWYSYAIHGTQEQSRVGKMITGGCINVAEDALSELSKRLRIGDKIEVFEAQ